MAMMNSGDKMTNGGGTEGVAASGEAADSAALAIEQQQGNLKANEMFEVTRVIVKEEENDNDSSDEEVGSSPNANVRLINNKNNQSKSMSPAAMRISDDRGGQGGRLSGGRRSEEPQLIRANSDIGSDGGGAHEKKFSTRFRVVKVPTEEPIRRGRWKCSDRKEEKAAKAAVTTKQSAVGESTATASQSTTAASEAVAMTVETGDQSLSNYSQTADVSATSPHSPSNTPHTPVDRSLNLEAELELDITRENHDIDSVITGGIEIVKQHLIKEVGEKVSSLHHKLSESLRISAKHSELSTQKTQELDQAAKKNKELVAKNIELEKKCEALLKAQSSDGIAGENERLKRELSTRTSELEAKTREVVKVSKDLENLEVEKHLLVFENSFYARTFPEAKAQLGQYYSEMSKQKE